MTSDKSDVADIKFIQRIGLAKRSFYDSTLFVLSCIAYGTSCKFFIG